MRLKAIYIDNAMDIKGEKSLKFIHKNGEDEAYCLDSATAKEIYKRVNEYDELKEKINKLKIEMVESNKWLEKLVREKAELTALNRELVEQLKIIKANYEQGYCLNDNMICDIEELIEKIKEVE